MNDIIHSDVQCLIVGISKSNPVCIKICRKYCLLQLFIIISCCQLTAGWKPQHVGAMFLLLCFELPFSSALCLNSNQCHFIISHIACFCSCIQPYFDRYSCCYLWSAFLSHFKVKINSAGYFYPIQSLKAFLSKGCGSPFQQLRFILTINGVIHECQPSMPCGIVFGWMHRVVPNW